MVSVKNGLPLATSGGMLVIVLFCIFTLASAVRYPGAFSPTDNWLSDLGNPTMNPGGDVYFNVGCILTGTAMLLMVAGLGIWKDGSNGTMLMAGRACGAISSIALMLVGVFTEVTPYHSITAFSFFALLALFLALTGAALWKHPGYSRLTACSSILVIVIDVIFVYTFIAFEHAPVWEWVAVFGGLVWVVLLASDSLKL